MRTDYRLPLVVFTSSIMLFGCAEDKHDDIPTDCTNVHWSHHEGEEGPEHWEHLCTGFSACGGAAQSPVNITGAASGVGLSFLGVDYGFTGVEIENNGHTVEFKCDAGSLVNIDGKDFQLLQFHYHAMSENTVEGVQYPLEVHFVNKAADGTYAVIGVMFRDAGDTTNALFSEFLQYFPTSKGTYTNELSEIDLFSLLPENLSYFHYSGSLTTPPCSEVVSWYVLKHTVVASSQQLSQFQSILNDNYRPVQPLNGRVIYSFDE
jgi:carbonic anhydrase